jgi:hypothetical protein
VDFSEENISVDIIALIKEEGCPPLTWRLGRISEVHHRKDGNVRVVTLRTREGSSVVSYVKSVPYKRKLLKKPIFLTGERVMFKPRLKHQRQWPKQ